MSVFSQIYKESADMVTHIQKYDKVNIKNYFLNIYESIACNAFKWENIPEQYIRNWIEILLYDYPLIGAFKDGEDIKIYPAVPNGTLLENGFYSNYLLIPVIGKPTNCKLEDVELLYNNSARVPTKCLVLPIVDKIVDTYLSIHNNITRAEVGGIMIAKEEAQVKAIQDAVLKTRIDNGVIKVILNENYTGDINYLPLFDNTKTDIKSLWESFDKDVALLESNLGFLTTDIFKKERLTEAESVSGYDSIQYGLIDDMLSFREDWVKRVKEHFNSEISVNLVRSYKDERDVHFSSDYNRNIINQYQGGNN